MLCAEGTELLHTFEHAIDGRAEAREELLLASEPLEALEDLLFTAKLTYSQAFVEWVTHRGICTECRTTSIKDDLTQFASV